jgi:hypothetical protein
MNGKRLFITMTTINQCSVMPVNDEPVKLPGLEPGKLYALVPSEHMIILLYEKKDLTRLRVSDYGIGNAVFLGFGKKPWGLHYGKFLVDGSVCYVILNHLFEWNRCEQGCKCRPVFTDEINGIEYKEIT